MIRNVRLSIAGALACCLGVVPSAHATGSFGPATRVTPDACWQLRIVADAYGGNHGFTNCHTGIRYVSGSAASWTTVATSFGEGGVLAVADDGSATYLIYTAEDGIYVGRRVRSGTHAGATTRRRVSATDAFAANIGGSIVASHGTWWAVWNEIRPGDSSHTDIYEARTMFSARNRTLVVQGPVNIEPSLALLSSGGVAMVWRRQALSPGGGDVWFGRSAGGAWALAKLITAADRPVMTARDRDLLLVYSTRARDRCPCPLRFMGRASDGHWGPKHTFTTPAGPDYFDPSIVAYRNHVLVGWTKWVASNTYASRIADRVNGAWTAERAVNSANRQVCDLTAAAGKVTAFLVPDAQGANTRAEATSAALS